MNLPRAAFAQAARSLTVYPRASDGPRRRRGGRPDGALARIAMPGNTLANGSRDEPAHRDHAPYQGRWPTHQAHIPGCGRLAEKRWVGLSNGARRCSPRAVSDLHAFADCIGNLTQQQAVALGSLRLDLPDKVEIITKQKLEKLNGAARPDLIARTGGHIVHPTGQLALALLDFDTKGMPLEVAARLKLGGYWAALVSVLPELASTARVTRRSTSAGIYRTDTGAKLPGSDGLHVYVLVKDGTDAERFLTTLHARCWLAGFGWLMVGAGGQLLERSIVDRMVGAPERLVFEGAPVLEPPLDQDQESRRPVVTEGMVLDTVACGPPLSIVEQAKLHELHAREAACRSPKKR